MNIHQTVPRYDCTSFAKCGKHSFAYCRKYGASECGPCEIVRGKPRNRVVFDGKDLIFDVDGIEIRNGKLPDSFSIKERYEISAESLTKLVVALGDGNTLAEFIDVQEGFNFSRETRAIYLLKDEYVNKLVEEIAKLEKK